MPNAAGDWRPINGVPAAWFEASSLTAAAEVAGDIVERAPTALVDVRRMGLRVRVASSEDAEATSAAARQRGVLADPAALQELSVVIDAADPDAVGQFWQRVLGYTRAGEHAAWPDPLGRDPELRVQQSTQRRVLRNRVHLDVSRPGDVVGSLGEGGGPYGLCHADPEGNEVDLVPGESLGEGEETSDWQVVFSAMACYRASSTRLQAELTRAAARLADAAGFPLLIDLRPGLVILDSGKDMWHADAHGLNLDFATLAAQLQSAARELGVRADPQLPRFVQLFVDAAHVAAVRDFWMAALGYRADPREGLTDIVDPRRLNPELVFQELDTSDTQRRQQRNRIAFELAVPADQAQARISGILAAGGRLLDDAAGRSRLADPEGNEVVVVSAG